MALAKAAEAVALRLRTWTSPPPPTSPASTQTPIPAAAPDAPSSWSKFGKVAIAMGVAVCAAGVSASGNTAG